MKPSSATPPSFKLPVHRNGRWIQDADGVCVAEINAAETGDYIVAALNTPRSEIAMRDNATMSSFGRIASAQLYHDSLRQARLAIRYHDGKEEDRAATPFEEHLFVRSATPGLKAVGLFWQTADGRWHLCEGATKRGDIHDNGRPIRIAYMGEEAPK